jgi:bacteriocin-like protein
MNDPEKSPPSSDDKPKPPPAAKDNKKEASELSDEDLDQVSGGLRSISSRRIGDPDDDFLP